MSEKLYDLEPLNVLVDGNEKFRKYLIELFIQTTPPILQDIKSSLEAEDWDNVYAHSHKVKPTLESMGMYALKPLINEIMQESKRRVSSPELTSKVSQLCATIDEAISQLQKDEL